MDAWTEGVSRIMGWEWTDAQREILEHPTRFTLISGGRRAGKSLFTGRWVVMRVLETIEKHAGERVEGGIIPIWLVGASYERCDQEFAYVASDLQRRFGEGVVNFTSRNVGPNEITVEAGAFQLVIRTKSATDEQTLEMEAPSAIAVCEAATITYSAYIRLLGRITQRSAPLLLSGSLEEEQGSGGWYVDFLKRWSSPAVWEREDRRSWKLASETNTFDFPKGSEDPELLERKQEMSEDDYNRFFMGVPMPPRGLVHPLFNMAIHVREVPWLPDEVVWLGVDPGIAGPAAGGSAYAILAAHLFPSEEPRMRIFDGIFVDNLTEQQILEDILMKRYWWGKSPTMGVIDRAGATRAGAHEASIEVWRKVAGLNLLYSKAPIPIPDQIRFWDSMLRVNETVGEPGVIMDVAATRGLQSELGGCESPLRPGVSDQVYRWNVLPDGANQGSVPRPTHCDAIKAAIYLGVQQFGYADARSISRVTRVRRYRDRK